MADINDYLDGLNYKLSAEEKQLMDILAECWEHCNKGDCHNCEYRSGNEWCKMLLCMSYQYAKRLIAAGYSKCLSPAADVAPVVHAHWYMRGGRACCSNCNVKSLWGSDWDGDKNHEREFVSAKSNYCPNCGAKMDEASDGT